MARKNYEGYNPNSWLCVPVMFLVFLQVSSGTQREVFFPKYSLPNLDVNAESGVVVLGNKITQPACASRCSKSGSCAGFSCHLSQHVTGSNSGNSILCERCYKLSFQNMLNNAGGASIVSPSIPQNIRNFRAFSHSFEQTATTSQGEYDLHLPEGLRHGAILFLQGKSSGPQFFFAIMDKEMGTSGKWPITELYVFVTCNIPSRPMQIVFDNFYTSWAGPYRSFPVGNFLTQGDIDMEWVVFVTEDTYSVFVNGKLVTNYPRQKRVTLSQLKYIRIYPAFTRVQWLMP